MIFPVQGALDDDDEVMFAFGRSGDGRISE